MASNIMTAKSIDALRPRDKQYEVTIGGVKGLKLRISPGGTRAFYLVDYFRGKRIRLKLGNYPAVTLAEARSRARKALVDLENGTNPAAEKQKAETGLLGFEKLTQDFISKYARNHNKDWRETERIFERYFLPKWRSRPYAEISKSDVVHILDSLIRQKKPSAANHAFRAVRKLFNWAIERGMIDTSPCLGLKEPARNIHRDRVLSDEELADIWSAAQSLGYPFGPITQLMILTGKRRGEVAGIAWSDLDFDRATWTLPASNSKNAEQHILPLMPMAHDILYPLPRLSKELVFPSNRSTSQNPVSGFGRAKKRLDELSEVSSWRFHDIRRTVATGLSRLGILPHVTERVLNHMTGSLSPVAKIYNRHHYLHEMREALEAWENHILSIIKQPT